MEHQLRQCEDCGNVFKPHPDSLIPGKRCLDCSLKRIEANRQEVLEAQKTGRPIKFTFGQLPKWNN